MAHIIWLHNDLKEDVILENLRNENSFAYIDLVVFEACVQVLDDILLGERIEVHQVTHSNHLKFGGFFTFTFPAFHGNEILDYNGKY